jgi:hypothetical protein
MLSVSGVNFSNRTNYPKTTNRVSYNPKLPQLKCDTVSFGNAPKAAAVGTDAILDLMRNCITLLTQGEKTLVHDAISLIQAGKINEAIKEIGKVAPPNGAIIEVAEGTKILAKNWDGSPVEHIFKNVPGFKNLGLIKSVNDSSRSEIFKAAFGYEPKTTVGMVGWSSVKPENVISKNPYTKAELTKKYEEAIDKFFTPVDEYFVKGLGIDPKDRVLLSSVSYSGVDKAIMDYGEKKGINTLTVTPFDYSIYGRTEHPLPTIITDTIPQYVDVYSTLSKNIVVTGGRDHAYKFDAGTKWVNPGKGLAIPIDVLDVYEHIKIPAKINGKTENAAALAYETFTDPIPAGLLAKFKKLPDVPEKNLLEHPAQKALASAIASDLGI